MSQVIYCTSNRLHRQLIFPIFQRHNWSACNDPTDYRDGFSNSPPVKRHDFFLPAEAMRYTLFQPEKENNSAQSLILYGCCNSSFYREIGQEVADFIFTHIGRMSFPMVKDKILYPFDISLLCSNTIVFEPNPVSNLIQEFWLPCVGFIKNFSFLIMIWFCTRFSWIVHDSAFPIIVFRIIISLTLSQMKRTKRPSGGLNRKQS